jgi:type I restriction enzyme M protein
VEFSNVTKSLPKWLENRYAVLWRKFRKDPFTFEQAEKILGEKDPKTLSVVLSDLRKFGWLTAKLDPYTSRKRLYTLKPPEVALDEIAENIKPTPLTEFLHELK